MHLEDLFIEAGGDVNWLSGGLTEVPRRINNLAKIINTLAINLWTLSSESLKEIIFTDSIEDKWSFKDFQKAFVVLTQFQKLSAIIFSFGIEVKTAVTK